VEIKTEADSNDMTECTHNDNPTGGMFGFPIVYSARINCFYIFCIHLILPVLHIV